MMGTSDPQPSMFYHINLMACGVGKWAKGSGASGAEPAGIGGKGVSEGPQAVCKNLPVRAGKRGGTRVGNPRWVRILAITAGSSMAAMMVKGPPQYGQDAMSIANTRLSNCAQLRRVRVEAEGGSPASAVGAVAWSGSPGTIWERSAAWGASTPWKRSRGH